MNSIVTAAAFSSLMENKGYSYCISLSVKMGQSPATPSSLLPKHPCFLAYSTASKLHFQLTELYICNSAKMGYIVILTNNGRNSLELNCHHPEETGILRHCTSPRRGDGYTIYMVGKYAEIPWCKILNCNRA